MSDRVWSQSSCLIPSQTENITLNTPQIVDEGGERVYQLPVGLSFPQFFDTVCASRGIAVFVKNTDGTNNGSILWTYTAGDGPSDSDMIYIIVRYRNSIRPKKITFDLTVNNIPPIAIFQVATEEIFEAEPVEFSLTDVVDPIALLDAPFQHAYDCTNDNIEDSVLDIQDMSASSTTCLYSESGAFSVSGRIQDKDGGINKYTLVVNVEEATVLTLESSECDISGTVVISYGAGVLNSPHDALGSLELLLDNAIVAVHTNLNDAEVLFTESISLYQGTHEFVLNVNTLNGSSNQTSLIIFCTVTPSGVGNPAYTPDN
ncbi:MAG: hypothetical protein K8L97_31015 [Anaerolineae bacterium]|nr:hypothetical protein [Anaerolineae bacterium]